MDELVNYLNTYQLFKTAIKKPIKLKLYIGDYMNAPPLSFNIMYKDESRLVKTIINNKVETSTTANKGDVIIVGPYKEAYTMKMRKFLQLYDIQRNIAIPKPLPRNVAHVSKKIFQSLGIKKPISFKAPWGEKMIIEPGDYLVKEKEGSYYRIEKNAFKRTYIFI